MRQLPVTLTVVCISRLCRASTREPSTFAGGAGRPDLYGTGDKPIDVKISEAIDSEMDRNTRSSGQSGGKYAG